MTSKVLMIALGLSSLSLAACDIHSSTYLYDEHPRRAVVVREGPPVYGPAYVEPTPIIVREEPPPPPVERIVVARPAPDYVWVEPYYSRVGDRWVVVHGHWERPPHPGAVWVPPRSERRNDGVHFSVGIWR